MPAGWEYCDGHVPHTIRRPHLKPSPTPATSTTARPRPRPGRPRVIGTTAAALLVAVTLSGCNRKGGPAASGTPPPVPVSVATAAMGEAPILIRTIGTAESQARVMLRPQVPGRVDQLGAPEGTDVTIDQLLLRLDPRPFESALKQAEANLARARALAADAHRLLERTRGTQAAAGLSQREIEEAQAGADAADADILANQAEVETAKLNLAYCTISAPFAGRLGQFLVKPGSIVKANETDLVEVAQTTPIEVVFSIPEQQLPAVRDAHAKSPLGVEATPGGETAPPATGTLTFVDNKVDTQTGTLRLKATFENPERRLWPGQFVNVTLILGRETGYVMVPESAVQPTQKGPAVFIVKPDQTVEVRPVTVRRIFEGQSIIEQGLRPGEIIVTDGQLRLAPGSKIVIKGQSAPAAQPASPTTPAAPAAAGAQK